MRASRLPQFRWCLALGVREEVEAAVIAASSTEKAEASKSLDAEYGADQYSISDRLADCAIDEPACS
jgi:hypothetical protein